MIAAEDLVEIVTRLNGFYQRRLDKNGLAIHAEEFAERLARFDLAIISRAVKAHIGNSYRYPSPDELLTRCLEYTRENEEADRRRQRLTVQERGGSPKSLGDVLAELGMTPEQLGAPRKASSGGANDGGPGE